jgi:hypothetical protein
MKPIEHAVGFVEHHHLDLLERDVAAFEVIDQATGTSNQHIDAAFERRLLDGQVNAAEGRADMEAGMLGVAAQVLCDLHAKLARRHDDQTAQARLTASQLVQHRQAERCSLATTCLAEANQFLAVEDLGNGVLLDIGRLFVAGVAHTLQDGLVQSEGIEAQSCSSRQWPPDVAANCSIVV